MNTSREDLTIYGPRAAVCFTEMPLFALEQYAEQRGKDSVEKYAVGVLKRELFAAGWRPVIYGLGGKHMERRPQGTNFGGWPRYLDPSCGLGEDALADADSLRCHRRPDGESPQPTVAPNSPATATAAPTATPAPTAAPILMTAVCPIEPPGTVRTNSGSP